MKVSLTPCINQYSTSFASKKKKQNDAEISVLTPAEQETNKIQVKRLKSALKVILGVLIAVNITYFTVKNRLKINKEQALAANKAAKIENLKDLVEPIVMQPPSFDDLPVIKLDA